MRSLDLNQLRLCGNLPENTPLSDCTCPVRPLEQWLRHAGIESGPVLRKVNRGENVRKAAWFRYHGLRQMRFPLIGTIAPGKSISFELVLRDLSTVSYIDVVSLK
jgi:hypothetical protein